VPAAAVAVARSIKDIPINMEEYAYLWNGSEEGWVLLKAPGLPGGYCIFNRSSSGLLHIESDDLNILLCERMRDAGCDILDNLPRGTPEIVAERNSGRHVVLRPAPAKKA
jgi:hypothetical protein